MADKVTIIKAIRNVTAETKLNSTHGVDNHSKAQEARGRRAAKQLLILLGIEKPSKAIVTTAILGSVKTTLSPDSVTQIRI